MNAQYLRELAPGEVLTFRDGTVDEHQAVSARRPGVLHLRVHLLLPPRLDGRAALASASCARAWASSSPCEHPVEADVVIAVPDSSVPAAIGYARRSGIPYDIGLIRSHYVGRTFIEPDQAIRDFGARIKYNPVRGVLEDKRVVVVDDSIVRGTTSKKIVNLIRGAGRARDTPAHQRAAVAQPVLLRSGHARARQAARRAPAGDRGDAQVLRRGLAGIHKHRGAAQGDAQDEHLLRRLLHRRVPRRAEAGQRVFEGSAGDAAARMTDTTTVRVQVEPEAADLPLPRVMTEGAAAADLRAALPGPFTLAPGAFASITTGIRLEIPRGFEGQVRPRSGLAARHGVTLLNSPGTIDSDYRGVVQVILVNHGSEPFTVNHGDRIAQLVIASVTCAAYERADELTGTERSDGGFGHTGVK